jgi:hypothetical protein
MNGLLERPRVVVALAGALVAIVVIAMLAGGALAGGDCPDKAGTGGQSPTQR